MLRQVLARPGLLLSKQRTFTSLSKNVSEAVLSVCHGSKTARHMAPQARLRLTDLKINPQVFLQKRLHSAAAAAEMPASESSAVNESQEEETPKNFADLETINPMTQKALTKVFKYKEMSKVQDAVLSQMPNQDDMFVKAKTGTGKTLAFLVAALETSMAGKSPNDLKHFEGTSILIVSPTRELASQIAEEARRLVSFYPYKVHCLVGGDSKRRQVLNLEKNRCDIVVATPGRLNDMLSSVRYFKKACENIKVLVLDEADQLLDMGFKAELQRILEQIPEQRQTMLFSATISNDIRRNLGNFALSPKHKVIDTVGKDEVNTHMHVKQSALVAPYDQQIHLLHNMLNTYKAANTGKVIIFMPTTKSTRLYAGLMKKLLPNRTVFELHSGKSQDQRSSISERFRKTNSGVLVTSDVSARGVDYPGVSLVVQVGVPSSREQYIHRLGRTGRAGREGEGVIVLAPFEQPFLKHVIGDLPVDTLESPTIGEDEMEKSKDIIEHSLRYMDEDILREVYTAYLGYYSGRMPDLHQPRSAVIGHANEFLTSLGVTEPPHLSPRFLTQLGLTGGKADRRDRDGGYRSSRPPRNDRYDSFGFGNRGDRGGRGDRDNFDRSSRYGRNDRSDSFGNRGDRDSFDRSSRFGRNDRSDDGFRRRSPPRSDRFSSRGNRDD